MADAGCTYAVMETSSHALCLDRVYGVHYEVGIFTNLTQDHLDFHVTMENYCDAKAILFRNCGVGVVNGDDPWTPRLLKDATCQVRTYGVKYEADLRAENVVLSADGIAFDAVTKTERVPIRVNIPAALWCIIRWMCWGPHGAGHFPEGQRCCSGQGPPCAGPGGGSPHPRQGLYHPH